MGIFAVRGRRLVAAGPEASESLTPGQRMGLPHRFEAVGEALASGSEGLEASLVVGQALADDGVPLADALDALRTTWQVVRDTDPPYDAVSVLAMAWSDTTMGYLHQMSCEDPLTGLASQPHLRTQVSTLYRGRAEGEANHHHALVVVELARRVVATSSNEDHFSRSMHLARVGDLVSTIFSHGETVARLGSSRVAVLADRDEHLGRRVRLLRTMLSGQGLDAADPRVWIEGLPSSDHTAAMLLDELARS